MTDYQKQAEDFADKHGLTMVANYLGHFVRLGEHATAQFRITLSRPNRKPYSFQYSDSTHNSWCYRSTERFERSKPGLPPRLRQEHWPKSGEEFNAGHWKVTPARPKPTLYDILTCLTKYDPGTFEDFCGSYGYDEDSRKAFEIYLDVQKEWTGARDLFSDCLEELEEIS